MGRRGVRFVLVKFVPEIEKMRKLRIFLGSSSRIAVGPPHPPPLGPLTYEQRGGGQHPEPMLGYLGLTCSW